ECNGWRGGQGIGARGEGDGADHLATSKAREPTRLLLFAAIKLDRLRRAEARCQEWRAAERPPCLMRDQPQFDQTKIKSAIGLGKRECSPALLLGRRPEILMISAAALE